MIRNIKVKRIVLKNGARKYLTYRYMTISFLKIFKISIGQLGFKKMDIRFEIKWGW
jgi:hypothetical protein